MHFEIGQAYILEYNIKTMESASQDHEECHDGLLVVNAVIISGVYGYVNAP
jgi:hypothetical protein